MIEIMREVNASLNTTSLSLNIKEKKKKRYIKINKIMYRHTYRIIFKDFIHININVV